MASSSRSSISFHFITVMRVLLFLEQPAQRLVVHVVGGVLEAIDLDRALVHVLALLERFDGDPDLHRRLPDQRRELARAVAERRHAVAPHDRGGRIDGVHHVVERRRQRVDVFAIDRRDERLVEPLDDLVGQRCRTPARSA